MSGSGRGFIERWASESPSIERSDTISLASMSALSDRQVFHPEHEMMGG
jgi:hypothetical protein